MKNCGLRIANCEFDFGTRFEIRNPKFEILLGPEAHQDEFSTFNREVVGSTPTRPMKNCGLMIAECGLPMASSIRNLKSSIRNLKSAIRNRGAEHSIGNREVASSIPAAGSGGESYGEDSSDRHRDKAPALRGVAQQGACAKAHSDQEISSRLDSSDGRAPIS